jgi:hypothetical protein
MIGRPRRTAQRPRPAGSIREWTSVAIQEWLDVTDRESWRASNPRFRTPRTSASHRRAFASRVEWLEDRSVPSGPGNLLSSLTTGLEVTTANIARDVVPPSSLGGSAVAPSSSSLPSDLSVGVVVSAATETVLDAVNSGVNPGGASGTPFVLGIGVDVGSQSGGTGDPDSDAIEASLALSIDVPGVISLSVELSTVMPGIGNLATGLAGTVGDALDTLERIVAGVPGVSGSGAGGGGISVGGGSGLGGTGTPISNPGITLTLPGLAVGVSLPLSSPIASTGGSQVTVPSPVPTLPALPGGSSVIATSPSLHEGNPLASLPTIPTFPSGSAGAPASPRSEDGSIAAPAFAQGSPVSVTPSGATGASPTGSIPGNAGAGDGPAFGTPADAFAPNTGPVAISTATGPAATGRAASSTTSSSDSATSSGPGGVLGNATVADPGRLQGASVLAGPSSVEPRGPADREIAPAELLPGDLEGLERALGRLMRGIDGLGEDLAARLTQFGTLEMLLSAGMLALACEVIRRWDRRRQDVTSRSPIGSSRRPGPFYRPRAFPSGRCGTRAPASTPAIA